MPIVINHSLIVTSYPPRLNSRCNHHHQYHPFVTCLTFSPPMVPRMIKKKKTDSPLFGTRALMNRSPNAYIQSLSEVGELYMLGLWVKALECGWFHTGRRDQVVYVWNLSSGVTTFSWVVARSCFCYSLFFLFIIIIVIIITILTLLSLSFLLLLPCVPHARININVNMSF